MSLIKRKIDHVPTFPTFFNDLFGKDFFNWDIDRVLGANDTIPSVNIEEKDDAYVVEMAAPGLDKKDFKVELNNNTLTISSTKEGNSETEEEGYKFREFNYRSFRRSFALPKEVVDEDKINAKYENGLLRVTIPKKEEAMLNTSKHIEIA